MRRKRAKAALARRPLAQWREVFARVEADPFMRGDNDRGWVAGIDYVLRAPGAKQEPAEAILARQPRHPGRCGVVRAEDEDHTAKNGGEHAW